MITATLYGRLTREPEHVTPRNGGDAYVRFSMACDNGKDRAATFVNVSVFGRRGDVIMQYFTKGNRIVAHVRNIEPSAYVGNDGEARATLNAVLDGMEFVETRADNTPTWSPQTATAPQTAPAPAAAPVPAYTQPAIPYQQQPTAAAPAPAYTQPAVPYQQPAAPQQTQLPDMPQAPAGVPWSR